MASVSESTMANEKSTINTGAESDHGLNKETLYAVLQVLKKHGLKVN